MLPTSGLKTSEFGMAVGGIIAVWICKFLGPDCDVTAMTTAVVAIAYIGARAFTKFAAHRDKPAA